ncbi:alpha/beta hydrolase family esterase [Parafrigoribacterium soli]|uniref:alpha/beta hydrolase family esterase n=1 Tax=Parafrigoribacterium soli TaxID=3144663 RepID=UPI0032EB00FA
MAVITAPHGGPVVENLTLVVDGKERRMLLVRPMSPARNAPLVLVFHGSNQTAATIRGFTEPGFDSYVARYGAVVVYLEGYRKHWNDARRSSNFAARTEGYDDVAFAGAVIGESQRRFGIDAAPAYAIGFSNGAQLVLRLVHEMPGRLAAVALISATQPAPENFAPASDAALPMPVLLIHGTKDPLVPYQGGVASLWGLRPRGLGLSAPQTAEYFARRNGIRTAPVTENLSVLSSTDDTRVSRTSYREAGLAPVALVTVHGGGHVIPGRKRAPRIMGRTSTQLSAADEISTFFGFGRAGR